LSLRSSVSSNQFSLPTATVRWGLRPSPQYR
jgi:hypothetical protein